MKRLFLFLTMFLITTAASAQIEQHQGFPVQVDNELRASIIVQDIDGDGKPEIIAAPENRVIKVFNYNGALKWENVGGRVQYDNGRIPLASDLNGDSRLEILSYGNPGWSDATFYIWDAAGNKLKEFWVGKYLVISSPAITKEGIILTGAAPGRAFDPITQATGVHAFDSQGNKLWYLELGNSVNFLASIPAGDIDGDGIDEAAVLTQDINSAYPTDGKIWLIKVTGTQGTILWSKDSGGDARSAAIGDLNGDGVNEVVAVSSGGVYIFDRNGNVLYNFKINGNRASPAIGDIDGDGINEVTIASSDDNKIYLISNGSLKEIPANRVTGNIALGDLNGDKKLELAAGDLYGNMYVWDYSGNLLETRNIAKKYDYFTSAVIADLEGDGNKEIILGNRNGNIYVYTYLSKPKDTIPPITTDDIDGQWHNSSITVTLTATDDNSGIAATYYTVDGSMPTINSAKGNTITLSEDGAYTIKYFSVDNAGNIEDVKTATNQVKIDKTPPSTKDDSDGRWHNSSVTVKLTALDNLAGVASTYHSVTSSTATWMESIISWLKSITGENITLQGENVSLSEEGIFDIYYYSIDNAGNIEAEKISKQVKIDKTPPAITVNTPQNKTYLHSDIITLSYSSQDALSGLGTLNSTIDGDMQVSSSQKLDMLQLSFGTHEFYIGSVDNAGNLNSRSVGFDVIATIESLQALTERGASNGWITGTGIANSLKAKLNSARQKMDAGQKAAARNIIEAYMNEIDAQTGKAVTAEGAAVLKNEAKYVIEHL